MHHDELAFGGIGQGLGKRRQYIAVVLTGVLVAVVVQVHLLVGLFGKGREHGVAFGHGLLVGDPEGLVAGLFHHADNRRCLEVQVRVFFVSEGQHLLQRFNGVGARGDDVIEHGQLVAQLVQLRRGVARVAVEAHALAVGRLADDQDKCGRLAGHAVLEVVQGRDLACTGEHALHVVQLLGVATIGDDHLPRHGRLDAGFETIDGQFHGFAGGDLLDQWVAHHRQDDGNGCHDGLAARQIHRAQARPQEDGEGGVGNERQHDPPGKVLGGVFAGFRDVRLEHDEDDALGEFLLVNEEITQARHGASPQHHADQGGEQARTTREQQHRRQPQRTHEEGLAEATEAGGAGQLDKKLGNTREIPEKQE